MKITTADCIAFLVAQAKAGEISAEWAYDDEECEVTKEQTEAALANPKNWFREKKIKLPAADPYYDEYEVRVNGVNDVEPAENFVVERSFQNRFEGFGGQCGYIVLERANGELVLGPNYES